jgi:L-ribulokinase
MTSSSYCIGLDFGTESARAVIVDVLTGQICASAAYNYPDCVIDRNLPGSGQDLPPGWALQNPADWLGAIEVIIPGVLRESGVSPEDLVGIGVDFTACTILPTTGDGTPLCRLKRWRYEPHAWPKLWKHHAAQPYADMVNRVALERDEEFIWLYGGRISSEWLIPKVLQILQEAPDVYDSAESIIEAGDWVVWQLTGNECRNSCAAGYKACWQKGVGHPHPGFLAALDPRLEDLVANKLGQVVAAPGTLAGGLRPEWAAKLGLRPNTAVGVAMVDAHAGTVGLGVAGPGVLAMLMGTSTCHMVMSHERVLVDGISGVVEDGIVPGLFGYEAGQVGTGDMLAWFLEFGVPRSYSSEAERKKLSLHDYLTEKSESLEPGETGLLALDWWNGCRTPLVDSELSGAVLGLTLATRPEDVYRALVESTAFGARLIVDLLVEQGIEVDHVVASGGLTNNRMLMQIYADIIGKEISTVGTDQASGLGAAMLGSTAAGAAMRGHYSLEDAAQHMAPQRADIYRPDQQRAALYDDLMAEYRRLFDRMGRQSDSALRVLRRLRNRIFAARS